MENNFIITLDADEIIDTIYEAYDIGYYDHALGKPYDANSIFKQKFAITQNLTQYDVHIKIKPPTFRAKINDAMLEGGVHIG